MRERPIDGPRWTEPKGAVFTQPTKKVPHGLRLAVRVKKGRDTGGEVAPRTVGALDAALERESPGPLAKQLAPAGKEGHGDGVFFTSRVSGEQNRMLTPTVQVLFRPAMRQSDSVQLEEHFLARNAQPCGLHSVSQRCAGLSISTENFPEPFNP
jgi:hypothetical protein